MEEWAVKKEKLTTTSYKFDIDMFRSSFSTEFIIDMVIHIQLTSDTLRVDPTRFKPKTS